MAKRPSLSEVIKREEPQAEVAAKPPTQPDTSQREPGKRRRGWVQLNVYIPKEVRTAAKVKALQEGRDISDVVTELLKAWSADS